MPDNFPTFEAVAALGVLLLAIRTYQLYRASRAIPRLERKVLELMAGAEEHAALRLATVSRAAGYPEILRSVLDAHERASLRKETPDRVEQRVGQALDQALRVQIRRLQSGRARDLVVLAVLLGSVLYLRRSPLAVGEWFYPLAGAGALLIVIGFLVRGKIVGLLTSAASALRAASLRLTGKAAPAALSGACERCGASERIVFERPEQLTLGGALAKAELTELSVCRSCGSLRAALRDPNLVPVGPEHGTRVDQNQSDLPSGVGLEEPEHEG